jgi:hypothetical protein
VKKRTQKRTRIKRDRRAYDDDPLGFVAALMKRHGEAGGREAFLKFVAENDPEMTEQAPALANFAARAFRGELKYDPEGSAGPERSATDERKSVTRLDDAKALREMGLPLSTPVEDRELSRSAEKKIMAVFKATRAFGNAVLPWAQKQTGQRYAAVRRTRKELKRALARVEPKNEEPESVMVALFTEPCRLVCAQWDKILTTLENGEAVTLTGEGAPWPLGPFPRNLGADSPR